MNHLSPKLSEKQIEERREEKEKILSSKIGKLRYKIYLESTGALLGSASEEYKANKLAASMSRPGLKCIVVDTGKVKKKNG